MQEDSSCSWWERPPTTYNRTTKQRNKSSLLSVIASLPREISVLGAATCLGAWAAGVLVAGGVEVQGRKDCTATTSQILPCAS